MAQTEAELIEKYEARTQSERAYDVLRQGILTGELLPGSQLKEILLCKTFGLSRTPIRHAFARLASEGLVEQIPNVGAFVRKLGDREIIQLMEVRRVIEAGTAAQAAERGDTDGASELARVARALDDAAEHTDDEKIVTLERQFHRQVVHLCANPEIDRIFDSLYAVFATLAKDGKPRPGRGLAPHAEIAAAIVAKDPTRAGQLMWRHLTEGLESLRREMP